MTLVANPNDYAGSVVAVREYLAAELDAASPSAVVAYCETSGGDVVELTLSDLVSTAHLAFASLPHEFTPDGWCATHSTADGPAWCDPPVTRANQRRRSVARERVGT